LLQLSQKGEHRGLLARTRMVVELGRFLVAESGVYLTRVLYVKRGLSKMVAIVDGGMHHNYVAAGGMGQVVRRNYELQVVTPGEPGGPTQPISVAGCLCTPNDVLGTEVDLPANIKPGDIVAVFNSGAYGFSASPLRFLSHPLPGEKLI
jgi:diaminopimelate decarboxylase